MRLVLHMRTAAIEQELGRPLADVELADCIGVVRDFGEVVEADLDGGRMQPEVKEWLEHLTEYVGGIVSAMLASDAPYNLQTDLREARIKFREQTENL